MGGGKRSSQGRRWPHKGRGWRNRDRKQIDPNSFSGVFLTKDPVQGVGDPASAHRTEKLRLLPS